MTKSIALFFISLALAATGRAQDTLTLEMAVATALRNNYEILLSKNDSAIAAINYEYRNAAFYPRLNASGTLLFNRNRSNQKLADGTERNSSGIRTTNFSSAINLNWTVFDGFRMFVLRDQLDQDVKIGNLMIKNQVITTVSDVVKTYFDIVRQRQQLANIREQMAFSEDRLKLAQYRLDIGVGIKPDVLQAQIDFNNQRGAEANQLALIDQRKQALNLLMNVPRDITYNVQDSIPLQQTLRVGDLINGLEDTNPQLQIARANIDLAALDIRSAKASRWPTVSLISAYNFSRVSNNTAVNPFTPLFNMNRGWNYGVTASIPIFNNFTVKQQIRQAELALNYRQLQYESQQANLTTDILNSYRAYQAQREVVTIAENNVGLARENLNIEKERYRLGRTTFIELRQAEENVATALTNLINARYNLKVAETDLLQIKGDLIR
ncbi:MAG: TolC family protein [Flavisolibacter sp.]